ncbi:LPXTG cell wall anchor domain-containing protein [Leucobacter insecticola]|uniref:LPXTG cell wall anchor domain-containing protein n=1 Tax=Leucobacter insecticola TaxID=2714934 RepID=A0A6G8FJY0_9MICO|nr:leucine-rich repeat domain-containing protein [Leucobacter insecticola]QIM16661.1 LPXTG cell wall anchor domain-containing protein [Leucobacter insecticola]
MREHIGIRRKASEIIGVGAVALLVLGSVFAGGSIAHGAPDDTVVFADRKLQECVAFALHYDTSATVTEAELADVANLFCGYSGITDLDGLEYATSLQYLELADNEISDLGPIAGLTSLRTLDVTGNQIASLEPLRGLSQLEAIYGKLNRVADLRPLADLAALEHLDLTANEVSELGSLAGLTQMRSLALAENHISDLTPLAALLDVNYLDLRQNQVGNLSALSGMSYLSSLNLEENRVTDVSPLQGKNRLSVVLLRANQIADVSPLAGLGPEWATLEDQVVTAPDAVVDVAVANPLRDTEGEVVPTADYCVEAGCAQQLYPDVATGVTTTWNVTDQLMRFEFSGTLVRNVVDPQTAPAPPTITGTPPNGVVGTPYTFDFIVSGDPDPTVSLNAQILPRGLELSATGTLSGVPTLAGTFTFTVQAENGVDPIATHEVTVVIAEPASTPPPKTNPPNTNPPNTNPGGEKPTVPDNPGGTLPRTGASQAEWALSVAAIALGGVGMVLAMRRRSRLS